MPDFVALLLGTIGALGMALLGRWVHQNAHRVARASRLGVEPAPWTIKFFRFVGIIWVVGSACAILLFLVSTGLLIVKRG